MQHDIVSVFKKVRPDIDWDDTSTHELPLTGGTLKLIAPEMVYLVLELQEHFHIKFCKEDFDDYKFNTFDSIAEIVQYRVQSNA